MLRKLLGKLMLTNNKVAPMVIRGTLGVVFFAHGSQKMLGWFGGPGFDGALEYFAGMNIPPFLGVVAISSEFFGSLALLLGLFTRLAALGIAVDMLVAIALVHIKYGFFMNWHGKQEGEGYEYALLVLAMTVFLMMEGAGAFSVDRKVSEGQLTRSLKDEYQTR